jgi:hypothetical protein
MALTIVSHSSSAQNFKADRLRKAVDVLGVQVSADSLMPDTTISLVAKDGRIVCLRTDPMGDVEHVGVPLFSDMMRLLQPSPVYDFLEFAVLNWKYKVNPNQLYLSKVIFKTGSWDTLLRYQLNECECSIENREDKLYIVTWRREDKDVAILGIPIEYELLNNDTRRNMERAFTMDLKNSKPYVAKSCSAVVSEESLSIYGTEGLFVVPGKSYIIDLLNQNVYYKLTTVYETADTVINNKPVTMSMEAVLPVVVIDPEFPAETFANLMMCDDASTPEVMMELDFHLSNYHREKVTIPLSQLKAFCRQQGCNLYFACDGVQKEKIRGVMFASNLSKGYNHLFSLRVPTEQLTSATPVVQADVYLYIPPVDKDKLFGTVPTKKSGANFKLP